MNLIILFRELLQPNQAETKQKNARVKIYLLGMSSHGNTYCHAGEKSLV